MPEEEKSIIEQIAQLRAQLDNCTNMSETIAVLMKLSLLLSQVDISSIPNVNNFLL